MAQQPFKSVILNVLHPTMSCCPKELSLDAPTWHASHCTRWLRVAHHVETANYRRKDGEKNGGQKEVMEQKLWRWTGWGAGQYGRNGIKPIAFHLQSRMFLHSTCSIQSAWVLKYVGIYFFQRLKSVCALSSCQRMPILNFQPSKSHKRGPTEAN